MCHRRREIAGRLRVRSALTTLPVRQAPTVTPVIAGAPLASLGSLSAFEKLVHASTSFGVKPVLTCRAGVLQASLESVQSAPGELVSVFIDCAEDLLQAPSRAPTKAGFERGISLVRRSSRISFVSLTMLRRLIGGSASLAPRV